MSEQQNTTGGFQAPPSVDSTANGAAQPPKNTGVMDKTKATKSAKKSVLAAQAAEQVEGAKSTKRDIQVVAIQKGWFDCKRIPIGKKFMVSEAEFSEKWMEKLK